jgi:hypothetical protein
MKSFALILLTVSLNLLLVAHGLAIRIPADTLRDNMQKKYAFVNVVNNTNYDVEDIIFWACNYLGIKNVTICVANQPRAFNNDGMLIKHDDLYFIYLKKRLLGVNKIIVHELIHIQQYERQELVRINPHTVNYKGNEFNLNKIDYLQRPFEVDAHAEDSRIVNKYFRFKRELRKNLRNLDVEPELNVASLSD